jgi:hypothetical protein
MLRRSAARAFVLLAVFLAAGSSLPSLDALVYHTRAGELQGSQPHVEPAGGCLSHAEDCTLGRTAPGSGAVGTTADRLHVASLTPPAPKSFVTQHVTRSYRSPLAQPRAPPATLS